MCCSTFKKLWENVKWAPSGGMNGLLITFGALGKGRCQFKDPKLKMRSERRI